MAESTRRPRKSSLRSKATSVAITMMAATDMTVKLVVRATDSQNRLSWKIFR